MARSARPARHARETAAGQNTAQRRRNLHSAERSLLRHRDGRGRHERIIYALAVTELAKSYRFSSIGGSSIGAFAAALTAAAEYSRRRGSNVGFELMAKLPTELADEDDQNQTRLLRCSGRRIEQADCSRYSSLRWIGSQPCRCLLWPNGSGPPALA